MAVQATLHGEPGYSAEMTGEHSAVYFTGSGSGTTVRLASVNLPASGWKGSSPYSQVVSIDGVTKNTKVDLQPSVEQLTIWHQKDLAFTTENDNGVVTVYAIGDKPANDYTVQVTLMEVTV